MKKTLKIILGGTLFFATAAPLCAQDNQMVSFGDSDLNAALGISNAWIWLQNSIVPLAKLVIFLGVVIIIAEFHHRQNKMLDEILRKITERPRRNSESVQ